VAEERRDVEVEGRTLSLSNLNKVMWPRTGTTKGEAIEYYAKVAPALLPHLAGAPEWVRSEPVGMDRTGEIDFVVCDDTASLVWLAQMGALELHPSLSKVETMECPSVLAFDLDPGPPAAMRECCTIGLLVRDLFANMGLESFAKTSGSKGLQVYVPLNGEATYDRTKPFAHAVARALEKAEPELVVSRMTKSLRIGKVLVDWSQNTRSKTTVAVYSLRARERPTVSTPVSWEEVEAGAAGDDGLVFEANDVLGRIEADGDLFAPVLSLEQPLPDGA
jgi:bifunctional non-homologous end joining protein LigD